MMKKAREFDNILDKCLERVLLNGEPIEQCLAEYPDYASELEPLLRTSLTVKEATSVKPRPQFRERARYQFQAAIGETEPKQRRGFFGWQPRWATAVIVVIVLLLAGSGTVAAAGNSMPDEPLYQVKLATEAVQLALTPSALGKAELYAKLADKRVAEIVKMADEGKVPQVEQATQRLNDNLVAMASLVAPAEEVMAGKEMATDAAEPPQTATLEAPQAQLRKAPVPAPTPAPATIPAPTPAPATPAPSAVEEAPAISEEAPTIMAPKASAPLEGTGQAKYGGKDEENIKPDKQARLKMLLSRRAVENQDALQAVLETAPESAKPALRQAIKQAAASYKQALRNLD
jgi:hypothetical protein